MHSGEKSNNCNLLGKPFECTSENTIWFSRDDYFGCSRFLHRPSFFSIFVFFWKWKVEKSHLHTYLKTHCNMILLRRLLWMQPIPAATIILFHPFPISKPVAWRLVLDHLFPRKALERGRKGLEQLLIERLIHNWEGGRTIIITTITTTTMDGMVFGKH